MNFHRNFQTDSHSNDHNSEVTSAINSLEEEVLPSFAESLDSRYANEGLRDIFVFDPVAELHQQGVNMYYLLFLASLVQNNDLQCELITEVVMRTIVKMIKVIYTFFW